MERRLALMAGAGVLPGRAAAEAARQGWRVVALAFDEAAGLDAHAERVVPSAITDIQEVLRTLDAERVQAAVFVGKFWKQRVFDKVGETDQAGRDLARAGLSDDALARMVGRADAAAAPCVSSIAGASSAARTRSGGRRPGPLTSP